MKLTEEDVKRVLKIVDQLECGEVRLEFGGLRLHVLKGHPVEGRLPDTRPAFETRSPAPAPAPLVAAPTAHAIPAAPADMPASGHVVRAPLAGVVYHAPKPGAPPYVKVGQSVSPDDTVCLMEVMKLFQSVAAGVAGRVTQVLAEDGSQIAEGQALFAIEPA